MTMKLFRSNSFRHAEFIFPTSAALPDCH
ncbi:hypothetical protein MHPYR_90081 [uncultured Mycobacterium sp.]|uniref:Uncharacterized protein n=1 Tax=uncultured Mycobacterium sp. TaxID=171292 RepID=A0A1Y5PU39_9MYCO|nr:hypothetical protein MHPYR_90081 [uncultured Mycobacterium sp.]